MRKFSIIHAILHEEDGSAKHVTIYTTRSITLNSVNPRMIELSEFMCMSSEHDP